MFFGSKSDKMFFMRILWLMAAVCGITAAVMLEELSPGKIVAGFKFFLIRFACPIKILKKLYPSP